VIILARLAIDQSAQGQGLGRALLVDAVMRVARLTDDAGIRALSSTPKTRMPARFYLSIAEFEPSPTDPLHLVLLLKDLKRALRPPSP
jgi:GNAT superfamily N-acetyltransferase